jgi:hypothetical protein
MRQVLSDSEKILMLSPDAPINQALIEYEGWLESTVSALGRAQGLLLQVQNDLIKEIILAIMEVQTAKKKEWL